MRLDENKRGTVISDELPTFLKNQNNYQKEILYIIIDL
jgi:hypothetical protein